MRISTKTLTSLLLVTTVTADPGLNERPPGKRRHELQLDRLLQHHDRKGELRAELLGIHPFMLKDMQRHMSFEGIVRRNGFSNVRTFRVALVGKLRHELHHRGWTTQRIDHYIASRRGRFA